MGHLAKPGRHLTEADAVEATVGLLRRIGDPVTRPALVHVKTVQPTDQAVVRNPRGTPRRLGRCPRPQLAGSYDPAVMTRHHR
jgi:hypothetical protein